MFPMRQSLFPTLRLADEIRHFERIFALCRDDSRVFNQENLTTHILSGEGQWLVS